MRRLPLEMLGWLLHIGIDIFTHREFFATHFLWPLSDLHFDGLPWETGWFLAANYAALAVVFLLLWGRMPRPSFAAKRGIHGGGAAGG